MSIILFLQGFLVIGTICECAGGGENVGACSFGNDSSDCSRDLLKCDSYRTSRSERIFSELLIEGPTGLRRKCRSFEAFLECMEEAAWSCEQNDQSPADKAIFKSGKFLRQLCIDHDYEFKKSFLYSTACINKHKSRTDLSCKPEKIYKNVTAWYPSIKASCQYQKALLECRRKYIDKQDTFVPELEKFFQSWTTSKTEKLTEICEEDCSQSREVSLEKGPPEMNLNEFRRFGAIPTVGAIPVAEELEEEVYAKVVVEPLFMLKAYDAALKEFVKFHTESKGKPDVDACDKEDCGFRKSDSLHKKPDDQKGTSNPSGAYLEEMGTLINDLETKVGSKYVVKPRRHGKIENVFEFKESSETKINYVLIGKPYVPL